MNGAFKISVAIGPEVVAEDVLFPMRLASQYAPMAAVPLRAGILDQFRNNEAIPISQQVESLLAECETLGKEFAKISVAEERLTVSKFSPS